MLPVVIHLRKSEMTHVAMKGWCFETAIIATGQKSTILIELYAFTLIYKDCVAYNSNKICAQVHASRNSDNSKILCMCQFGPWP